MPSFSRALLRKQKAVAPMQVGHGHEMADNENMAPIARLSLPRFRMFSFESFILLHRAI